MKLNFRLGKRFGFDRLTDEQKDVVERLERDEITEAEAERRLGGDVRVVEWRIGASSDQREEKGGGGEAPVSAEDARAREMIERIAREVDSESGG